MNAQRGFGIVAAVMGLFLLAAACSLQGTARADGDSEELTAKNPLIDCSTNAGYSDKYIASAFKAGGGHTAGRNQQCNACHSSSRPQVGQGDRPSAEQGTALIQNLLTERVTYELKMGKNGEWEKFTLDPGKVRRHTWKYKTPGQNRSPQFYVRYEDDAKKRERKVTPVATPNKNLGSVYFFDRDTDDKQVYLWDPGTQVSRR